MPPLAKPKAIWGTTMTSRGPFIWTQLYLPVPLTPPAARAALTALANLAGNPRIVLEATGSDGTVFWRLGCDATVASRAVAAIAPHLFGMRTERTSASDGKLRRVTEAAQVSFSLRLNLAMRFS